MEVSHINHMDTHAIIGGGKVQVAKTAQTAEFFEILSSTLYSNKKLAVVREILCNANDANRDIGKAGTPVVVNINFREFTVKDIGPGIPREKMRDIYLVYGESTKSHDGKQTGGFGLGSKAPYAYAKNFAVTSEHKGLRTIYNLSRGTTESGGIPDLREIVTVPCETSGLTVSIPLQDPKDEREFHKLFKEVAFMGGIPITLNGTTYRGINYKRAEEDGLPFIITPQSLFPSYLSTNGGYGYKAIFVKYGAVVYPVSEEITKKLFMGTEFADHVAINSAHVIFLAPPHSISVVPSREQLGYTDKTINTIKNLIERSWEFMKQFQPNAVELRKNKVLSYITKNTEPNMDQIARCLLPGGSAYSYIMSQIGNVALNISDKTSIVSIEKLREYSTGKFSNKADIQAKACQELIQADPNQTRFSDLARKHLKKTYPQHYKLFHKLIQRRAQRYVIKYGNFRSPYESLQREMVRQTANLMTHIENKFPADVRLHVFNTYADLYENRGNGHTANNLREVLVKSRRHNDFGRELIETKRGIREFPVMVARSEAALKRVMKGNEKLGSHNYGLKIICRKKEELQNLHQYLEKLGFTDIHDIVKQDEGIKLPKAGERKHLIGYDHDAGRFFGYRHTIEPIQYYLYVPRDQMIESVTGKFLSQRKINLHTQQLKAICYLYPNLVLASGQGDAVQFESEGLTNVFQAIADEAAEYLNQNGNLELFMHHIDSFAAYHYDYQLSLVLKSLGPAKLMEVFGKEPSYMPPPDVIPTVMDLFLKILKGRLPPKYGVQYIHKTAQDFTDRFKIYFGDGTKVLHTPEFELFFKHFPTVEMMKGTTRLVFQSALMSVIQTLLLQQKLSLMETT